MIQRNPAIQFASSNKIKVWQEERLQEELIYLQEHSPFYSGLFRRAGSTPRRYAASRSCSSSGDDQGGPATA